MAVRLPGEMRKVSIKRACLRVARRHGLTAVTPARVLAEVHPPMGHSQLWRVVGNTRELLKLAAEGAREQGDTRIIADAEELGI
jgi:hypothetical protein